MFKNQLTAPTAKKSNRVQRKPSVLSQPLNLAFAKSPNKAKGFGFIETYGGSIYCKLIGKDLYQIRWRDNLGRSVLAFGGNLMAAYLNLENKFNDKYPTHGRFQ